MGTVMILTAEEARFLMLVSTLSPEGRELMRSLMLKVVAANQAVIAGEGAP